MSRTPDLVLAVFHWVEYLGLLGGLGAVIVRRLGRMPPRIPWAEPPMHIAFATALAGGLALLVLTPSVFGAARVIAEGAALFLCLRGIPRVAIFAVLAPALVSFTGHATGIGIFADVLHVLSAGMWAGGILALASLRPPEGWRSAEARTLLERFGQIAFIAFGITALTGVLRATEQLHGIGDLWSTPYGVVLSIKTIGVALMLALSVAWRRGWPASRLEAAVAIAVIAATALLAGFQPLN